MKPARCSNCTRAETHWRHPNYTPGCPDCDLRKLAMAKGHIRVAALDHVERNVGRGPAQCLREKLQLELARIKLLKGTK